FPNPDAFRFWCHEGPRHDLCQSLSEHLASLFFVVGFRGFSEAFSVLAVLHPNQRRIRPSIEATVALLPSHVRFSFRCCCPYFAIRACTALRAISERCTAVSFFFRAAAPFLPILDSSDSERAFALAFPPSLPRTCAAGFFLTFIIIPDGRLDAK